MYQSDCVVDRITFNPSQCGGRPCIRGMRIRVEDALDLLAAGVEEAEILEDHPYLEAEDIRACLEYAAAEKDPSPPAKAAPLAPKTGARPKGGNDPGETRDLRYDRLFPGKARVSFEEYAASQNGDPAAVQERFAKQDKDGDGFVTRDEFIGRTQ